MDSGNFLPQSTDGEVENDFIRPSVLFRDKIKSDAVTPKKPVWVYLLEVFQN